MSYSTLIEFETERLWGRQWRVEDREPFAQLNADSRVMECFPQPLDRAASDSLADRCQSLIADRGWGFWAIALKPHHRFIGFVGLHIPSTELPFSPCVEVGWRLAYDHWGKGYAPEAAQGALQVGFEQLNLLEIVSFTAICNHRSRRVMEKIGMRETAETFEHPQVPIGHPLRLHCLYRLLREDWQAMQPKPALN